MTSLRFLIALLAAFSLPFVVFSQLGNAQITTTGLIQDLDADVGVATSGSSVTSWANQGTGGDSVSTNNGSPQLITGAVNGHNAISFTADRMAGTSTTAFDANVSGSGYTWFAVVNPDRNPGAKNQIFGTLINGSPYNGQTAGIGNPSNSPYAMYRAGSDQFTTGASQNLDRGGYHVLAGRLAAGTGSQLQEVFVNGVMTADGFGNINVSGSASAGQLTIGAERAGGGERYDGDIARILIYDRPLTSTELSDTFNALATLYNVNAAAKTAPTLLSWSFENGLADDQTGGNEFAVVSGTAFSSQPVTYAATGDSNNPYGGDQFLLRSDHRADGSPTKPGDGPQGVVESDTFIVPELAMLLVEAAGNGGIIELVDAGSDATLLTITPGLTSTTLAEFDTDISQFAGTEAYLRISDNSSGGWGHISVDNLAITGFEFVAVPEPSSWAIFAIVGLFGGAAFFITRRC